MPLPSQVIVLVEDQLQKQLVFRYLRQLNFKPRQIRIEKSPSGVGSGEQWVRERFPIEVTACRIRDASALTGLIAMIDADTHTASARKRQLTTALNASNVTPLRQQEKICVLVPKRNVETWVQCLILASANEATDYKSTRSDWNDLISQAADQLYQWTRPNISVPATCVPSLKEGVKELKKIEN